MEETLRKEVRNLTTRLGAMVQEQCGRKVFAAIESLRGLSKRIRQQPEPALLEANDRAVHSLSLPEAKDVAHAFSLFFHLVNLCEERERIRRLTAYEHHEAGAPMSLRRTFKELKRNGVPVQSVKRMLDSMRIEPVLTAHPTEAKRRSVFNHILRIGQTLDGACGESGTALDRQIDPWIEALWLTDEVRERPVTLQVEIENTLVYFERCIYDLAGDFWEHFIDELRRVYPRLPEPLPFFQFGSWVGTDRDGNPNVTREASFQAAETHRQTVLRYYIGACQQLLAVVSFPCRHQALARRIERDLRLSMQKFPATQIFADADQPQEYYRRKLRIMIWRLGRTVERAAGQYETAQEFLKDACLLERLLAAQPSPRIASLGPGRLRVALQVFGFHGVSHDFRQHSSLIRAATSELLRAAGAPEDPAEARVESIRRLLAKSAPLPDPVTVAAEKTIDEFRTLKDMQRQYGPEAAHRYILSMTMSAADVWDVVLLARKAGLVEPLGGSKLRSQTDIVPLFETYTDLIACPEILDQLLSDPLYRSLAHSRGNFQEIMLGYSDSVKDSGYVAANWSLFRAQDRLQRVAQRHGVKLGLFHGKGGTIDRGGGMSYRSVQAQPHAAPGGRLRITEQGEVISFKYSNPVIARRNLEQLASSVLDANLLHRQRVPAALLDEWEHIAHELAETSRAFYRRLVYETPEFPQYFFQATPIDLIDQLRLGSRPSRRYRSREIENLRAIPWVFAWTQSRHFLPSWYGAGFAMDEFIRRHAQGLQLLRKMYREWPFFSVLIDNAEVSLAKTDLYIAGRYARLVRPAAIREKVFARIQEEYERTVRRALEIREGRQLLERQPVLAESIRLRNPYVDPLNFLQLCYLERWRRGGHTSPELLHLLQITVGGIAFGMKSTG